MQSKTFTNGRIRRADYDASTQQLDLHWDDKTVRAYKHVPLVEHNPAAGIKNNVLGTLRTAQAAAENGVADFVLISTDKAVRPTNVMGASKRLAEMALQALAATQNTWGHVPQGVSPSLRRKTCQKSHFDNL